jgi:hypothetical protein
LKPVAAFASITIVSVLLFMTPADAQPREHAASTPILLLIHGRDQSAGTMRATANEWRSAIRTGLEKANVSGLVSGNEAHFVWYADRLDPKKGCAFFSGKSEGIADPQILATIRDSILSIASQMPNALERRLAETIVGDTELYLSDAGVACAVDYTIQEAFLRRRGAPIVVIAHSMGSMVVYRILMDYFGRIGLASPVYLITMGSMVAQPSVQRALLGSHAAYPAPVPVPVVWWRNLINKGDILAFAARDAFYSGTPTKRAQDVIIDAPGASRHSALVYLSSGEFGRTLREAMCLACSAKPACK